MYCKLRLLALQAQNKKMFILHILYCVDLGEIHVAFLISPYGYHGNLPVAAVTSHVFKKILELTVCYRLLCWSQERNVFCLI